MSQTEYVLKVKLTRVKEILEAWSEKAYPSIDSPLYEATKLVRETCEIHNELHPLSKKSEATGSCTQTLDSLKS